MHPWYTCPPTHATLSLIRFRASNRYRTPYAPWGGFTNGYEGNLRAHLTSTQGDALNKHRRGSSFGLGGGLRGLVRPAPYLNYNTPPSSSSSSSPPYMSIQAARFDSVAATSPSSFASYDAMSAGAKMSHHSPQQTNMDPFAGSPVAAMGPFDMRPPATTPLHPAIRPQYSSAWQHSYQPSVSPFAQGKRSPSGLAALRHADHATPRPAAARDVNFSPQSPITAGVSVLAASPSFQPGPFPFTTPPIAPPSFSAPLMAPPASSAGTTDTPAEQMKQQLRRISDPPLPSSYSVPHPAIRREVAAHAPVSSQIPASMPTPAQAPASEPQQFEPHLHQPTPRPESNLKQVHAPQSSQHSRPQQVPTLTSAQPAPLTPVESQLALVEQMMINLRRASEMAMRR